MKTKDFIELLKKEDPSGEATVVVGSYPVVSASVDPGYWDGHYWKAIDKNGKECINTSPEKMVLTSEGCKLRIGYYEVDSFIWSKTFNKKVVLEDILDFNSGYYFESDRNELKERWLKQLKETYKDAIIEKDRSDKEWIEKTTLLLTESIVYSVKNDTDKYWRFYQEKGWNDEALCFGYISCLNDHPELFEYEESPDKSRREWKLKQIA